MKKKLHFVNRALYIVVFILGITVISPLTAQVPDYFANNPEWKMNSAFGANGPCVTEFDYVLYVQGDSIIGPYTYKKMHTRGTYHYIFVIAPGCSYTDHFADSPSLLVRQDSTRIWKYNSLGDELLYDFNLQVGDTLPMGGYNVWNDTILVDSISTLMVSSSLRKVFHLSNGPSLNGHVKLLIEGIAALSFDNDGGFLVDFPPCFECLQHFSCFALNDTVYFPSFQAACNLNVGVEEMLENYPIRFYPNPVEDFVVLKLPGNNLINIECANLMGQQFQITFEQIAADDWKVNTSHLNKGIYFLRIQNGAYRSTIKIFKN
jgi:hypothetical protein